MRDEMLKLQAAGKLNAVQSLVLAKTKPKEELYDLQTDQHEVRNLAEVPAHRAIKAELANHLDGWIRSTNDTGLMGTAK